VSCDCTRTSGTGRTLFRAMDSVLRTHPEVGEYNQKI
jgi:hypothetical protein